MDLLIVEAVKHLNNEREFLDWFLWSAEIYSEEFHVFKMVNEFWWSELFFCRVKLWVWFFLLDHVHINNDLTTDEVFMLLFDKPRKEEVLDALQWQWSLLKRWDFIFSILLFYALYAVHEQEVLRGFRLAVSLSTSEVHDGIHCIKTARWYWIAKDRYCLMVSKQMICG